MSHRPSAIVVLAVIATAAVSMLTDPENTMQAAPKRGPHVPKSSVKRTTGLPQYLPQSYGMSVAYYSVRGNLEARLTLNNKGMNVLTPRVTLYGRDGRRHAFNDISVGPRTFTELDVRRLAAEAGEGFEDGSLRVTYTGKIMEMGGMLRMTNQETGIEFDEQLMYPNPVRSNRLEAVWAVPSPQTSARLVVTNATSAEVEATIRFDQSPGRKPETLKLGPWQLEVLDLGEVQDGGDIGPETLMRAPRPRATRGGISIEYTGTAGGVLARGLVADSRTGYSAVIPFIDPRESKSSMLRSGGVRVAPIGDHAMRPVIVARNTSTTPAVLTGRLQVTSADGTTRAIELPAASLRPHGISMIDALEAWKGAAQLTRDSNVGLEFEYTTAPGTVVVSAASVSDDLRHAFRVPLYDHTALPSSTGGYFWHLESNRNTVVFIQNVTDKPQLYNFLLRHAEGVWTQGLRKIAPRETAVVDIGAIRDGQVRDRKGRTIPVTVEGGQVHWSLVGSDEKLALLGRVEQVDLVAGISSTYACPQPIEDIFDDAWIEPGYDWIMSGYDVGYWAMEQDRDGLSNQLDEPFDISDNLSWYASNSNVAYPEMGYPGWFWGGDEGYTQVNAYGESVGFLYWNGEGEEPEGHESLSLWADIQVVAPIPVNIRWFSLTAFNGLSNQHPLPTLFVNYIWGSSSGSLSDLGACEIWEDKNYGTWTNPPFYGQPQNGQAKMANANTGGFEDTHGTQGPVLTDGGQPSSGTGNLVQLYKYRCTTVSNNALQDMSGNNAGPHTVARVVSVDGSNWNFAISKHGSTASCALRTSSIAGWCQ